MNSFSKVVARVLKILPTEAASAHCDIPCGIYDPIAAKIAAQTVQKMVMRIQALKRPGPNDPPAAFEAFSNSLSRYITVKEEHAQFCKKELLILWSDYFKPEHLQKYVDLHSTFWQAAKLCSKNKQEVNLDAAKQLVNAVDMISDIFWATKNTTFKDTVAQVRFGA